METEASRQLVLDYYEALGDPAKLEKILAGYKLRLEANGHGLVFANGADSPVDPDVFVRRRFLLAVKAADVGTLRFHDLRHAFGSLRIEQGENLKYV